MSNTIDLAIIVGSKSPKGWHVTVEIEDVVHSLSTPEERVALLERIASTASEEAARIRGNISANARDE